MLKKGCPFCEEEIYGASLLCEGDKAFILQNIAPATDAHFVVIPRKHALILEDLGRDESFELLRLIGLAEKVALEKGAEGVYPFALRGEMVGQTIEHLHFQIIGKFKKDLPVIPIRGEEKKILRTEELRLKVKSLKPFFITEGDLEKRKHHCCRCRSINSSD